MTREARRPYDDRQRAELCIYEPRMAGNTGSWKRPGRVSPTDFRGNVTLLTRGIQISRLQNWGRMHFSCFKPPNVWYFVREALGNDYKGETNS